MEKKHTQSKASSKGGSKGAFEDDLRDSESRKLFAFDLDGTLVHDLGAERSIPDFLIESVNRLSKQHDIIVATGRRFRTALPDIQSIQTVNYAVVHNGSVVSDLSGKTHRSQALAPQDFGWILEWFLRHEVPMLLVMDGYLENMDFGFLEPQLQRSPMLQKIQERSRGHHCIFRNENEINKLRDENEIKDRSGPTVFLEIATLGSPDEMRALKDRIELDLPSGLRALNVQRIGHSEWSALEILPQSVSKWSGVQWVAEQLGRHEVICVGDDDNDIEMLREASLGVAMAHAQARVREVADTVVDGPQGLLEFLKAYEKS